MALGTVSVERELLLSSEPSANIPSTIEFLPSLQAQIAGAKMVLVWDGAASHHRCQEFRNFFAPVDQGEDGQIHSVRFAPYAPEEHPIETGEKLSNYYHHSSNSVGLSHLGRSSWSCSFSSDDLPCLI